MKQYPSWTLEQMAQKAVEGKGWLHSHGIEVGPEGTFLVCYYKPNDTVPVGWGPIEKTGWKPEKVFIQL